jgi:hypothetical protein
MTTTITNGTRAETRRNYATNPSEGAFITGAAAPAGFGGVTPTIATTSGVGAFDGNRWTRVTVGASPTTTPGNNQDLLTGIGVSSQFTNAGIAWTISTYVRSNIAQRVRAQMQWLNGAASNGTVQGADVTLVPNVWTRLSVVNSVAPINTTAFRFDIDAAAGAIAWTAGDTFDYDGILIEQTSELRDFFHGFTVNSGDLQHTWAAGSNTSQSIQTDLIRITPLLMLGYDASADTAAVKRDILGAASPAVTLAPTKLRTGSLAFLFENAATAWAAYDFLSATTTFRLQDTDIARVAMNFVPVGNIRIGLDTETRVLWMLSIDFAEVA